MTRAEAWCVHLSTLSVGGTGLVYAWMRYLCEPADELALVNHPLEPTLQHLHLLLAPLLLFAVGLVWRSHAWARARSGYAARRSSGFVLLALFWPMVFSGVLVQVAEGELLRAAAIASHALTGLGWCLAFVLHLFGPRPAKG